MTERFVPCLFLENGGIEHADPCTCSGNWGRQDDRWRPEVRLVGPSVVGSAEWRAAHCEKGDVALAKADERLAKAMSTEGRMDAAIWASVAQAHYAAANVRYRS